MKKILHLLIALLVGWSSLVSAQGPSDQRAFHTKVADVLALMPAPNKTQFNTNMDAIAKLSFGLIVFVHCIIINSPSYSILACRLVRYNLTR